MVSTLVILVVFISSAKHLNRYTLRDNTDKSASFVYQDKLKLGIPVVISNSSKIYPHDFFLVYRDKEVNLGLSRSIHIESTLNIRGKGTAPVSHHSGVTLGCVQVLVEAIRA